MGIDFLGFNLFEGDVQACADEIASTALSDARECMVMACLNPHSYITAREDLSFRTALKGARWLVPDGIGVVLAARLLGLQISERVTGPDTFSAVMDRLDARRGSVFFLGSSEETLRKIRERIAHTYPGISLAGTYSPPFKPEFSADDNEAMVAAINAASPDILWVGMTAPKQEKWLAQHRHQLNVGAAGAIGAAFDFFAGTVKRSPRLFQVFGLEWLPRLVQQPRRLWRRMFISAPLFLFEIYRARRTRSEQHKS